MSFDQLVQPNSIDLIGNTNDLVALNYFRELDDLVHQLSLKSSKPFFIDGEILRPTPQLYQFDSAIRNFTILSNQLKCSHIFNDNKVKSTSIYALNMIEHLLSYNQWFDLQKINQNPYKKQIRFNLDRLWNEIRGCKSFNEIERDINFRNKLIKDQRSENSKIVSRLLKKHSRIQFHKLIGKINIFGNLQPTEFCKTEKEIIKLKKAFLSQLQYLNKDKLFCIQWKVQQTLSGLYYLNILVYHSMEHPLNMQLDHSKLIFKFDGNDQKTIQVQFENDISNLFIENNSHQAINLERWKIIFDNMLYSLKYYYYQSKVISPKFSSIIY